MKWIQNSQSQPDGAGRPSPRGFTMIERLGVIAIIATLAARCGVPALHAADTTFTKITTGAIVTDQGMFAGCAWGDYNNDGYEDLFVPNNQVGGHNFLYLNNRDGTFTKTSTGSIVTDGGNSVACVWGDYDNDGFLDLLVTNPGGFTARPSFLYHNNGDGTFQKITSDRVVTDVKETFDASWADYDNDGYIDLFVGDFGGAGNALYHNNGGRTFDRILAGPIVHDGGSSYISAWADYNNDGFLDLFVVNWWDAAINYLYRNNGDGTFVKITAGSGMNAVSKSAGCAWGDYDNDGFPDLFVSRGSSFTSEINMLFHNNGIGAFTKVTSGSIVSDAGFSLNCAWGDYDNDGFLDLFISRWGQDNVLYHNNGDGTFTKVLAGSLVNDGGDSHGCAWADYDNDGFLDLFVTNGSTVGAGTYSNFLYRNDGNTNQWIKLKLVGTVSNRAAIGAKVRVKATIGGNTVWQLREISGGSGWGGQGSLVAHFGLRDATSIDTVRIEWPSGIVQEMHNVAAKQFLTVTEPARVQSVPASNPFVLLLDGFWEPVAAVPGNLGLALPHLSNGKYKQVTIYNLASGFPGPTDEVVGTAYAMGGEGVIAYGLRDGALTAKFVGNNLVTTTNADGSTTMTGTWELNIMEATGIYQSFVGGRIHMVDVLKYNLDGTVLEHCFCHISPPLLVTIRTSQVEVCWNSEANLTYQVQYRSDLTTNLWTSLVDRVQSTGATSCLSDPVVAGQPQRFYRVVLTNSVPAL